MGSSAWREAAAHGQQKVLLGTSRTVWMQCWYPGAWQDLAVPGNWGLGTAWGGSAMGKGGICALPIFFPHLGHHSLPGTVLCPRQRELTWLPRAQLLLPPAHSG